MLKLTCLCGQVRIEVAKRPDFINACNCTLCCKSGARWSYFHPSEVSVEGATRAYSREDKDDRAADIHFCGRCVSTTHFTLTQSAISKFGNVQTGVNMLLADESDLIGLELRYPDGRAWSGGADFRYVREPRVMAHESLAKARHRNDDLRSLLLERVPIGWKHPIDKNTLRFKMLEHFRAQNRAHFC
jgi:hypothetical protein